MGTNEVLLFLLSAGQCIEGEVNRLKSLLGVRESGDSRVRVQLM